jgi:aminopeptidase N
VALIQSEPAEVQAPDRFGAGSGWPVDNHLGMATSVRAWAVMQRLLLLALVLVVGGGETASAQTRLGNGATAPIGVTDYDVYLEPDPAAKTVSGVVTLTLSRKARSGDTVLLDRGELDIETVVGAGARLRFELSPRKVLVWLADTAERPRQLTIRYRGAPRSGLLFFPEHHVMYTLFATSQWMVTQDAPDRRATLRLRVVVPRGWTVVSNGRAVSQRALSDRAEVSEWRQNRPVPTYTFGFVAGELSIAAQRMPGVDLHYLATGLSMAEMRSFFGESARMVDFFQRRAGVRFPGDRYSQVVVPQTAGQEMAGFAVVSEAYARAVLTDPQAGSLLAHELAHQWWGNMVTCRAWTHFWLNEGFATFMAAAYREDRFGRGVYLKDIEGMRGQYERVRDAGHDRALVFPDWNRPTADDRTLVYQKGGYVLHLLRELVGDAAFWAGISQYTTRHFGQSVTTEDFRRAMERASRRDLGPFFAEWVYLTR